MFSWIFNSSISAKETHGGFGWKSSFPRTRTSFPRLTMRSCQCLHFVKWKICGSVSNYLPELSCNHFRFLKIIKHFNSCKLWISFSSNDLLSLEYQLISNQNFLLKQKIPFATNISFYFFFLVQRYITIFSHNLVMKQLQYRKQKLAINHWVLDRGFRY